MKYHVCYRWIFNSLDPDIGVVSGKIQKVFDLSSDFEVANREIHQILKGENPITLRRSYDLLALVSLESPPLEHCPNCNALILTHGGMHAKCLNCHT